MRIHGICIVSLLIAAWFIAGCEEAEQLTLDSNTLHSTALAAPDQGLCCVNVATGELMVVVPDKANCNVLVPIELIDAAVRISVDDAHHFWAFISASDGWSVTATYDCITAPLYGLVTDVAGETIVHEIPSTTVDRIGIFPGGCCRAMTYIFDDTMFCAGEEVTTLAADGAEYNIPTTYAYTTSRNYFPDLTDVIIAALADTDCDLYSILDFPFGGGGQY